VRLLVASNLSATCSVTPLACHALAFAGGRRYMLFATRDYQSACRFGGNSRIRLTPFSTVCWHSGYEYEASW
jgi:hypothetical protein